MCAYVAPLSKDYKGHLQLFILRTAFWSKKTVYAHSAEVWNAAKSTASQWLFFNWGVHGAWVYYG